MEDFENCSGHVAERTVWMRDQQKDRVGAGLEQMCRNRAEIKCMLVWRELAKSNDGRGAGKKWWTRGRNKIGGDDGVDNKMLRQRQFVHRESNYW